MKNKPKETEETMKYRLFASDMDGTLLLPDGSISERAVAAIRAWEAVGGYFTLATGRPFCGVRRYTAALSLRTPLILYNGAAVADAQSGRLLYERCLCPSDAEKILAFADENRVTACIWSGEKLFVNRLSERAYAYRVPFGIDPLPIENAPAEVRDSITKILFYDDRDRIAFLQKKAATLEMTGTIFATSSPTFLEFTHCEASKGNALLWLADRLGIAKEATAAIGDGMNDLSLLRAAGLGIAMGNAAASLKAAAGFVTGANTEDGLALALEELLAHPRP